MFRKLVAISLLVSFVAMSTSGLMMFAVNQPSFTIQMHAVHKMFGLITVAAMSCHLFLNYRHLKSYLSARQPAMFAGLLVILLIGLYGRTLTQAVPPDLAHELDSLARQAN